MSLPIKSYWLSLYIAKLNSDGTRPSTIIFAVSSISWHHSIRNLPDAANCVPIKRMLMSAKEVIGPKATTLPICLTLLHDLVNLAGTVLKDIYQRRLTISIMLLMYHVCLRVGEVIGTSSSSHTLKIERRLYNQQ